MYLPRMVIHTATGEAIRVYNISVFTFHMKVSIHTASLEIVHAHRETCNRPNGSQKAELDSVLSQRLDGRSVISVSDVDARVR